MFFGRNIGGNIGLFGIILGKVDFNILFGVNMELFFLVVIEDWEKLDILLFGKIFFLKNILWLNNLVFDFVNN